MNNDQWISVVIVPPTDEVLLFYSRGVPTLAQLEEFASRAGWDLLHCAWEISTLKKPHDYYKEARLYHLGKPSRLDPPEGENNE